MKKNNKEEDISIKVNQIEIKYINDPAYLTFLEFQGIDVKRINDPEYRTFLESKEIKFLTEDMLIETTKATKLKKEPEEAKKLEAQKLAKENLQAEKIEGQLRIQEEIEYLEQLVASGCVVRDDPDPLPPIIQVVYVRDEDMLTETTKGMKLKKEQEEAKQLEAQKLAEDNLQAEKIEEQLRIQEEIEYLEQLVASGCVVRDDDSFTEVVHVLGYNPEF
ncbi:MAG: hypothetical protein J0M23_05170 [Rickettsiales bacterium]|nr:hypothetical protein [Rickettsiales bacterium]